MVGRPAQLRQEYESDERARHYQGQRWEHSPRARRTNAKEQAIVESFFQSLEPKLWRNRVLDMPCGTGRFRPLLRSYFTEVWSVDAAASMLQQAPPEFGFQASAHAIPLCDDAVDVILCSRLLHHFDTSEQRLQVLGELARVTRKWICMSYFDAASVQAWRNKLRGRFRGRYPLAKQQWLAELNAVGLEECRRVYIAKGWSEQVWVWAKCVR